MGVEGLLPWGSGTAAAVAEALQAGLKVHVAEGGFRLAGRAFPAGTAIVRVAENPDTARETLGRISRRHDVEAVAADSGYVEEGVSLGSGKVGLLKPPRVLLAWDRPTSSLSAGWARWVLERRYGQAVTAVRVSSLGRVDLARYDVLVLPSGDYTEALGRGAVQRLRDWVKAGGTRVALGEASRWLTREKVSLLATTTELRDGRPETEPSEEKEGTEKPKAMDKDAKPEPFDLEKAIQPERERPDAVPGALLRVVLDPEHWLAAGTDGEVHAIVKAVASSPRSSSTRARTSGSTRRRTRSWGALVWDDAPMTMGTAFCRRHSGHLV